MTKRDSAALFAAVIFVAFCGGLSAAPPQSLQTYYVDYSSETGEYESLGDPIRLFGTITLDPNQPVGFAIESTRLFFAHEDDPLIRLPSLPVYTDGVTESLAWSVREDNLYISRLPGATNSVIGWPLNHPDGGVFRFGAERADHQIFIDNDVDHVHRLYLKDSSGPDGPFGFKVGTLVPEPSTLYLAGLGIVGLVLWGRYRY